MLLVDAVVVRVREGQVRNTPFYVVMGGVTASGERDFGHLGRRRWRGRAVLAAGNLRAEEPEDALIAVCDGLKGLPEAITTTWERTVVQQCIVHVIRNSFR